MAALTKDEFIAKKPAMAIVDAPDLGEVRVSEMSAMLLLEFIERSAALPAANTSAAAHPAHLALMEYVLARTIVDEHGRRLFTQEEFDDVWLPTKALQPLFLKVIELSRLDEPADAPKKSSETTQISTSRAA